MIFNNFGHSVALSIPYIIIVELPVLLVHCKIAFLWKLREFLMVSWLFAL